jgi:branched-subunit amino acid aminotransferase/4-amino-4-deoxychorismate lyase
MILFISSVASEPLISPLTLKYHLSAKPGAYTCLLLTTFSLTHWSSHILRLHQSALILSIPLNLDLITLESISFNLIKRIALKFKHQYSSYKVVILIPKPISTVKIFKRRKSLKLLYYVFRLKSNLL